MVRMRRCLLLILGLHFRASHGCPSKPTPRTSDRNASSFLHQPRPFSVKSAVLTVHGSLPVYSGKRTFSRSGGMSQTCHKRPISLLSTAGLFNQPVPEGHQGRVG